MPPNSTDGIHIHAGTTCANATLVGGHYWTPATNPDPWTSVQWRSLASGVAITEYTVNTGYPLARHWGHAEVVHALNGARVGCGVLTSTTMPPTTAPTQSPTWAPTLSPASTNGTSTRSGSHRGESAITIVLIVVMVVVLIACCVGYCVRDKQKGQKYNDMQSSRGGEELSTTPNAVFVAGNDDAGSSSHYDGYIDFGHGDTDA